MNGVTSQHKTPFYICIHMQTNTYIHKHIDYIFTHGQTHLHLQIWFQAKSTDCSYTPDLPFGLTVTYFSSHLSFFNKSFFQFLYFLPLKQ